MINHRIFPVLTQNERDLLWLHLLFAVGCALVLLAPIGIRSGVRMLLLVVTYNLAVPCWG